MKTIPTLRLALLTATCALTVYGCRGAEASSSNAYEASGPAPSPAPVEAPLMKPISCTGRPLVDGATLPANMIAPVWSKLTYGLGQGGVRTPWYLFYKLDAAGPMLQENLGRTGQVGRFQVELENAFYYRSDMWTVELTAGQNIGKTFVLGDCQETYQFSALVETIAQTPACLASLTSIAGILNANAPMVPSIGFGDEPAHGRVDFDAVSDAALIAAGGNACVKRLALKGDQLGGIVCPPVAPGHPALCKDFNVKIKRDADFRTCAYRIMASGEANGSYVAALPSEGDLGSLNFFSPHGDVATQALTALSCVESVSLIGDHGNDH